MTRTAIKEIAMGNVLAPQMGITPGVCETTVNGWVWYCDEHDTHGNADNEAEALYVGEAHSEFYAQFDIEECEILVFQKG